MRNNANIVLIDCPRIFLKKFQSMIENYIGSIGMKSKCFNESVVFKSLFFFL